MPEHNKAANIRRKIQQYLQQRAALITLLEESLQLRNEDLLALSPEMQIQDDRDLSEREENEEFQDKATHTELENKGGFAQFVNMYGKRLTEGSHIRGVQAVHYNPETDEITLGKADCK